MSKLFLPKDQKDLSELVGREEDCGFHFSNECLFYSKDSWIYSLDSFENEPKCWSKQCADVEFLQYHDGGIIGAYNVAKNDGFEALIFDVLKDARLHHDNEGKIVDLFLGDAHNAQGRREIMYALNLNDLMFNPHNGYHSKISFLDTPHSHFPYKNPLKFAACDKNGEMYIANRDKGSIQGCFNEAFWGYSEVSFFDSIYGDILLACPGVDRYLIKDLIQDVTIAEREESVDHIFGFAGDIFDVGASGKMYEIGENEMIYDFKGPIDSIIAVPRKVLGGLV